MDKKNGSENKSVRKKAAKGPNQLLRARTAIVIILVLVIGFGASIARLSYLTIVQGSELQEKAVDQQLKDTTIRAKRGSIYDVNGEVLAESASVWQVVMAPAYFENDEQRAYAAKGLSKILDLEYDSVYEKTKQNSYYVIVKRKIETEQRDEVLKLIEELDDKFKCGRAIDLLDDYKRYYPKNDLMSCVLGFTGSDDQGLEGIEYQYDSYLSGTPGRIVTAKNARGTDMPFQYEQSVDAEDGNNIYLTIDENIQSICEKYMKQAIEDNNVLNRGVCIAMDVNTGAVLSMVTVGGYDLNDPFTLPESKLEEISELPEEEQAAAKSAALTAMWRNKAISDTYMPGSVFKICTSAMALEEGLVDDNSTFYCSGEVNVADAPTIHCHKRTGHGTQSFVQAICNSCNPAFVQIGQLLGINKFRQYYEAFGFSEKTGIDLPGESEDSFWSEDDMNEVDLAVASFGQNFSITPIQMITACAAVANGGYVLQPYVVSKITDSNGNVVKNVEKKVKRQVVSEETSSKMNAILGYNAQTAGSTAGYVAGYKVAGKTGTSEKVGVSKEEKQSHFDKDYISSFCGYAPYDDPQIAMLVFFDTPDGDAYYGSQVSSPVFIQIMSEVLPYLEVKTDYTESELEHIDVSVSDYTGLSVSEAQEKAEQDGFTTTVKGEGEKVVSQIPAVNSNVRNGGNIVLYTDDSSKQEKVMTPYLIGRTASEVNRLASECGLNVRFKGASTSGAISSSQDIDSGTLVSPGTVITVTFTSSSTMAD